MTADEITALHLGFTAVNTAGNKETLVPNIPPSNYTVSPYKTTETVFKRLYNNYEFTFIPVPHGKRPDLHPDPALRTSGEGNKQALRRFCVDHYRRSECRQGG